MKDYEEKQRSFICEVGDIVKIARKPDNAELCEWGNFWDDQMDQCINKTGKILNIHYHGILIKVDDVIGPSKQQYGWYFPYSSLALLR